MTTNYLFNVTDEVIDLEPTSGPDGRTVWSPIRGTYSLDGDAINVNPFETPPTAGSSIVVKPGGTLETTGDGADLSVIPTERMSAEGSWDRIVRAMQDAEAGRTPRDEIVVTPGGGLVPVSKGTAGPQLSTVPEVRMSAGRATMSDLAEARRLDPHNVERWQFVNDPVIPGLRFTVTPVTTPYTFFTFRSAAHAGFWFLSPLKPSFDGQYSHAVHMLPLTIGGEVIPVVCANESSSAHRSLSAIRGTAAKFATYHSFKANGHVPFKA